MAEGMCATCSRYLLIIFNFLFWVSGGALLGVGIWIRVDDAIEGTLMRFVNLNNLPLDILNTGAYVLIAIGAFIFITGFCGCCGAIRESACMLMIYIGCLTLVFLGELAGGIYIAVQKEHLEQMLFDDLSQQVYNYSTPGNSTMDFIQIQFHCCGAHNASDYKNSVYFLNLTQEQTEWIVPDSCCKNFTSSTTKLSNADRKICQGEAKEGVGDVQLRREGCYSQILDWVYKNSTILIGIAVGIACLEILGIIFAACLCRNRTEYWSDWDEE